MMDCSETNRQMIAFLEGSLPEKERLQVYNHLKKCKRCTEFSSFMELSLNQINIERRVEEDQQFLDGIFEKIDSKPKPATGIRRVVATIAVASVIVFAVFTGTNIAKYSSVTYMLDENSINDDILFANEISREPIENYFLINENEKK